MRTLKEAVYSNFIMLTLVPVEEILVREVDRKEFYFADESDGESEESEEEEDY